MDDKPSNNSPPLLDQDKAPSSFDLGHAIARLPAWSRIAAIILIVLLSSVGYLKSIFRQNDETSKTETVSLDQDDLSARKVVSSFILTDATGNKHSITDFKGRVVILSFWASWCAPCLIDLPEFSRIQQRFADRGLEIVPINVDDGIRGIEFAQEFWKTKNFSFQSYYDSAKTIAGQFEVDTLPANFVLDRAGRLAFSSFGANNWTGEETVQILEDLLEESP